jgi:hypothetical protein
VSHHPVLLLDGRRGDPRSARAATATRRPSKRSAASRLSTDLGLRSFIAQHRRERGVLARGAAFSALANSASNANSRRNDHSDPQAQCEAHDRPVAASEDRSLPSGAGNERHGNPGGSGNWNLARPRATFVGVTIVVIAAPFLSVVTHLNVWPFMISTCRGQCTDLTEIPTRCWRSLIWVSTVAGVSLLSCAPGAGLSPTAGARLPR